MTACVFCDRQDQPAPLFETESLIVMPDKYPLARGHVLIIPREHIRCYGAAPLALLDELDQAAERVRQFLLESYRLPIVITETGAQGQSVEHAHLHLMPLPLATLPPTFTRHPDVVPIEGWIEVQTRYQDTGKYYYLQFDGRRYLMPAQNSVPMDILRAAVVEVTGIEHVHGRFVKTTGSEDIAELTCRWIAGVMESP